MSSVRWNVVVSPDTDQSVRMYLAGRGGGRKGDLSRFIEDAVRARILELTVEQAKASNVDVSEQELADAVAQSLLWARER